MQSFKCKCKIVYFEITVLPVQQWFGGTLNNSEFVNHWRIIVFIIIHDIVYYPKSFTLKSLLTSDVKRFSQMLRGLQFILFEKTNAPCNIVYRHLIFVHHEGEPIQVFY